MARLIRLFEASGSLLLVAGLWYLATSSGAVSEFLLPSPGVVLARIADDTSSGEMPTSLLLTLRTAGLGFAAAGVLGTILGIAMARIRLVHWFFDPLVSLGFPMPKIAFLPVFLANDLGYSPAVIGGCLFALQ